MERQFEDADPYALFKKMHFRDLLVGWAEGYVREGRLDVKGLTDEQIHGALMRLLKADVVDTDEEDCDPRPTISFGSSLLKEARRLEGRGQTDLAVMLYATWFEHWLNRMILSGVVKRGMVEDAGRRIIRTSSVEAKTGDVWRLLFDEDFPADIAAAIRTIAARRNVFVHYKWPRMTFEDRRSDHVERAEMAIPRCLQLEDQLLYGGARGPIVRAIRSRYPDLPDTDTWLESHPLP